MPVHEVEPLPFRRRRVSDIPGFEGSVHNIENRVANNRAVMKAFTSLELHDAGVVGVDRANNHEDLLTRILAGEEVEHSLEYIMDAIADYQSFEETRLHIRVKQNTNILWKRELFFGKATALHKNTMIAALRKRPDLASELTEWYRLLNYVSQENFPEEHTGDVETTADTIIRDVEKYRAFQKSKLPAMTMLIGKRLCQARKLRHREYDASSVSQRPIRNLRSEMKASCGLYPIAIDNLNEGKTLVASILLQGNRVIAIGADDTVGIDQKFDRENIDNISMTEHFKVEGYFTPEPNEDRQENQRDTFDFGDLNDPFDFSDPGRDVRKFPITEAVFEIIEKAVEETCEDKRAIITARILVTDYSVSIFSLGEAGNGPLRTNKIRNYDDLTDNTISLLPTPDFEREIEEIENMAEEALEKRRLEECIKHLDFNQEELNDPVNMRMVEILNDAVKEYQSIDSASLTKQWDEIVQLRQNSRLFSEATTTRLEKFNKARSNSDLNTNPENRHE